MKLLNKITGLLVTKPNTTDKKAVGTAGEKSACKFIKKEGYRVIEKNYRTKYGEIEIIGIEGDTLCFAEVKSRSRSDYGTPEQFVTKHKQKRLWKTASIYIEEKKPESENFRFDVVAVDLENSKTEIFKNAFQLEVSF